MEHKHNSTHRFSNRADQYSLYRPQYPQAVIDYLKEAIGLNPASNIADVGAGTGIFSKLLLDAGFAVTAVEPNDEMRKAAEASLNSYPNFRSIAGTAEETTLANHSVDLVTVAQAFHWFRPEETCQEFWRILNASGHILLLWNILQTDHPFLKAYSDLKAKYENTIQHTHRANLERIREIFAPNEVVTQNFRNAQQLNAEGFKGYFQSFSTVPLQDDARYEPMMQELNKLFDTYQQNGLVTMEYETQLFLIAKQA